MVPRTPAEPSDTGSKTRSETDERRDGRDDAPAPARDGGEDPGAEPRVGGDDHDGDVRVVRTGDRRPSMAVVSAVADLAGVPPHGLPVPLNDAVDADALDALFRDSTVDGRVSFRYDGYRVIVRSDGQVLVRRSAGR